MDEDKYDSPPPPFFGLIRLGLPPNFDGSVFDQTKFDEIAGRFEIENATEINLLISALLAAEALYTSEEAAAAQSQPSGALKAQAQKIGKAASKLHELLLALRKPLPDTALLQWHYERASTALVASPKLRPTHPLSHTDTSTDETEYLSPRLDQIIPNLDYLAYLARLSEVVANGLASAPPGRKEKRSIRLMVDVIRVCWKADLGRTVSFNKDPLYPNTEFENFLEACTAPIAPGRWSEIESIASHMPNGLK